MTRFLICSICLSVLLPGSIGAAWSNAPAKPSDTPIDYKGFVALTNEVEQYRETRLISIDEFKRLAARENTIILDTRSQSAFDLRHLKGAVHLNFSDFTEEKLAAAIPNKETTILIYCNNNFKDDPVAFPTKMDPLALNVPTFINLYGYGYRNIYELKDFLAVDDPALEFEGAMQQIEVQGLNAIMDESLRK